jgi:hypothetical protein
MDHREEVKRIFDALVEGLKDGLDDFGTYLAMDGKAIRTHGRGRKREGEKEADGRRDVDADWGVKRYRGVREDGTVWEKVRSWFGYKLHLVVDATYELPVGYCVTTASVSELPTVRELFEKLKEDHPEVIERCGYGIADRGYDDGKFISELWEEYEIRPVIDIRNAWKDGEETKGLGDVWNVVYSYKGEVYCENPNGEERRAMAYGGFERKRRTLKYRCPAKHYGYECSGERWCGVGKAVRIPMEEDRRIFTPLARSSYRWKDIYKKRTAVERVNSRLDVSFGFEQHYIRGLQKMELRCSIALCVMLAMALGRVKQKKHDYIRSLVQVA